MSRHHLTRRALLGYAALAASGLLAQACQPKVVEKIVEKPVTVKETVMVAGTPQTVEKVITPTPQPAPQGPPIIRLTVWSYAPDFVTYLALATAFEKAVPDVKLQLEQYVGDYYSKLTANFAAGNSADVVYMQGFEWHLFGDAGLLLPLDDLIKANNAQSLWPEFEIYQQSTMWRGHTYMSPMDSGAYAMAYNKDLFDKRGVPYPTEDMTWDEFKDVAAALSYKEGDTKYYGYHHGCGDIIMWMQPMRKDGLLEWDRIVEPTKATWNQPAIIEELQWLACDVYQKGIVPLPEETAGGAVSFFGGQAAMSIFGPWALPSAWGPAATTEGGLNYGVVPVPQGKTRKAEMFGQVSGHTISKATKSPEAAFKVITFLLSDDAQKRLADDGRMPGQTKILEGYWPGTVDEKYNLDNPQAYVAALQEGRYFCISAGDFTYNRIRAAGKPLPAASEAMMNGKPASEVIPDLNTKLQADLDEYWKTHQ